MHTYQATVSREGEFWIIAVPELDGHVTADGGVNYSTVTQAMSESEVERQARDFIATVTDTSEFDLTITY